MLKNILLAAALTLVLLPLSVFAQAAHPTLSPSRTSNDSYVSPLTAPTYCNPCLFYGGDWDPTASNWVAYINLNTTALGQATNYVPFTVPSGQTWSIGGMFTNNLAVNISKLDPAKADWSIVSGISEGVGGTTIASGTSHASFTPTGRVFMNGGTTYTEYTVLVKFTPLVTVPSGSYWMSVVPECTNSGDSACGSAEYFNTDSTSKTNAFGPPEPRNMTFANWATGGLNYTNVCNEGYPPPSCTTMSAGILGHKSHGGN